MSADVLDITGPVRLMTIEVAARAWNVPVSTVRRWAAQGSIHAARLGGVWLIAQPKGSSWREGQRPLTPKRTVGGYRR